MRRRDFIAWAGASGAALALPRVALGQQAARKVPRVAFGDGGEPAANLVPTSTNPITAAFFDEMARLGFVDGQNIRYEKYYAPSGNAQDTARAIVASNPDLIFLRGASTTALAVMALTKTIPVLVTSADPLGQGIVSNLSRPGGNVAAVATAASSDAEGKNLALLAEAVPRAKRIAYIGVGTAGQFNPAQQGYVKSAMGAAMRLGVTLTAVAAHDPADEGAFRDAMVAAGSVDAIQFGTHTQVQTSSPTLAKLTLEARLPGISPFDTFCPAGGLLSYGSNGPDNVRKAAGYVALILNGARPGDLPVLQPTVFDFVVNLKTAKVFGLTVSPSVVLQATQVIE